MDNTNIMDIVKLKGIASAIVLIVILTSGVLFFYTIGSETVIGMIKGDDYIYYDWKQIPLLLIIPSMVYADILCLSIILPYGKKIISILLRILNPVLFFTCAIFVIGVILSMVISVYPLGTDYYKCDSTSIVSSGSHYAKSKEICKERAYSSSRESETQKTK